MMHIIVFGRWCRVDRIFLGSFETFEKVLIEERILLGLLNVNENFNEGRADVEVESVFSEFTAFQLPSILAP